MNIFSSQNNEEKFEEDIKSQGIYLLKTNNNKNL